MGGQHHGGLQQTGADGTGVGQADDDGFPFVQESSGSQQFHDPTLTGNGGPEMAPPATEHFMMFYSDFQNVQTVNPAVTFRSSTDSGTNAEQNSLWSYSNQNHIATESVTDPETSYFDCHDFAPMASQGDSGPSPFQSRCYAQDHAAENVASVQQPSESHFASSSSGAGVDHTHQLKRSIDDMSDLEQLTEIENLVRQRKEAIRLQTFGRSPPGLATATVPLRPNSNSVIAPTTPGISQYGAIAPAAALPEEVTSFTFTHNRDKAWHRRIQSNVDVKASMARRSCATRRCRRGDTNDADGPSTYQCTWNCGCSFKRKWEWHRHQENREPQGAWVCFLCCERHEMTPFVNFREDKFFEHLRSKRHSIQKDDTDTLRDLARKSQWSMPRLQRRRCGYGDHVTTGWNEWLKHLEDHYTGRANVRKIRNGEFYDTDENRQSDTRKCYHTDNRSARRLAVPVRDAAGSSKHGPNSANHTKNASRPEGSQGNRSATSKGAHSTHPNYHHSYEMLEFRASKSHVAITITIAELWKGLKHRESLGNGTFCRVEKVSHSRIGDLALKSHDLGKTGTGPAKHIEREIRILSVLNHPNVVRMVTAARKSSEHSFLMWPAAHTDLDKYLRNPTAHSCIAPQDIIGGLTGLACGLHYMHSQSVTHNDIKPENILLDHASFLFADFGAAGEHGPRCRCPRKPQNYMYEAPEVRLGSYAADKADVFSLGLVFTQLLLLLAYGPQSDWSAIQPADTLASRQTSTWVLRFQALKRGVQRLGGVVGQISGRLYRLCHAMTQSSSEKRPTAASVIADLSQALHLLPSAVISYDGVANCAYVGVTRSGRAKRSHGESQPLYVMQPANGARRTGITVHWSMILQHEMQSKLDLYSKRPRLMLASQQLDVNAPSSQDLGTLPPRLLVLSMSEGRAMCKIIEKGGPEWPLMTPRYAALADQTRLAQRAFVEDQGPLQDWTDISQLPHTLHGAAAAALGCGLQYIWVDWLAGLGRSMQITDNTIMTIFRLSSMFMTASFQSMPKSFSQDHNMCHWTTICPLPEFSERYGAGNFAPQAKQPPATRLSRAIILNDLRKKCPDCVRNGSCRLSFPTNNSDLVDHDRESPHQSSLTCHADHASAFHHSCSNESHSTYSNYTTLDHTSQYGHDDISGDEKHYGDLQLRDLLGLDPLRGIWAVHRTNFDSSWWDVDSAASLKEFTYSSFEVA